MIATAKLPGPRALRGGDLAGDAEHDQRRGARQPASASTARQAATSAEPAQPIAVTRAISGWPLAMAATRAPSATRSRLAGQRQPRCRVVA